MFKEEQMATRAETGTAQGQQQVAQDISRTNFPQNEVVEQLQRQVANAFVLYTNYKHYHWQT